MQLAFSTSWIDGDPARIESVLPHVDSIEIGTKGNSEFFREIASILRIGKKPVTSVHASCGPHKTEEDPYYTPHFLSTDTALRQHDIEQVALSAQWARKIGARAVVLHTGRIDDPELKSIYLEYKKSLQEGGLEDRLTEMKRDIVKKRSELMTGHLHGIISDLKSLCSQYPYIIFCFETRVHYYEVPLPDEAFTILDRLHFPNLGYWHDVGHTFILEKLGFQTQESWQRDLSGRCIGTHLHDVDKQLNDHLPPGMGEMDFHRVLKQFGKGCIHTLEIHSRHALEDVLMGIKRIRGYSMSG